MIEIIPVFIWWFLIEVLGLLSIPIVFSICKNLPDNGYFISKIIGMLLVTYITWILVNIGIFEYGIFAILVSVLIIFVVSFHLFTKEIKNITTFFREKKKLILIIEGLFLLSYISFIIYRYYDNSILDAEKPQDFMFINGILRSTRFPLNDPWYTGKPVQYYYFGYMIIATLTKISNINPAITFNLSLATLFALTATMSFGVLYNLTKKFKYGILGIVFVTIIGNLRGLHQVISEGKFLPFDYWLSAHYIIPGTINEFPYFSFLHGDLHPHVIAIPFTILCITLILNIFKSKESGLKIFGESKLLGLFILAISIGGLAFMNIWDFPTYLLLAVLTIGIQQYLMIKKINSSFIKNAGFLIISVIILSIVLYLPFHLSVSSVRSLGIVQKRTEIQYFLAIYLFFISLILPFLVLEVKSLKKWNKDLFIGISLFLLILTALTREATILILFLVGMCGFVLIKNLTSKNIQDETLFSVLILFVGLLLALGIEIVYIDDAFVGDLERVNTVFKIGMQIWILLAISSSYLFYYLRNDFLKDFRKKTAILWLIVFSFLLFSSMIYPIFATITKANNNYNFYNKIATLDGRAWMKGMDVCDYDSIKWLNENIAGVPVILEAVGNSFTWTSCVSFNTGLPTVLGWEGHEEQWRVNELSEISDRANDVDKIFTTADTALMKKYNISYVYIGKLERDKYLQEDLNKFEKFEKVYENLKVKIYKVS
jgi:YYY domain-containing protein